MNKLEKLLLPKLVKLILIGVGLIFLNDFSHGIGSRAAQVPKPKLAPFSYREELKGADLRESRHDVSTCKVAPALINEIKSYQPIVNRILAAATSTDSTPSWKGRTYANLTNFVTRFPHRLYGSSMLENSVDFTENYMKLSGGGFGISISEYPHMQISDHVILHWNGISVEQQVILLEPEVEELAILGLGSSVGTTDEGITAQVVVVPSIEWMQANSGMVKGKIVVYNQKYTSFNESLRYIRKGASEAAKVGAVAALVKPIPPVSLHMPQAGWNDYDQGVRQIPVACITVEDVQLLEQFQSSGQRIRIKLKMLVSKGEAKSRNAIGELKGRTKPDEFVILSGHIDNWDVGQGAMDSGVACGLSWDIISFFNSMKLRPKRSLEVILWTASEPGFLGAKEFVKKNGWLARKIVAAFQPDSGVFRPKGLDFVGTKEAGCMVNEILKLFRAINATTYAMHTHVSTDIGLLTALGVPSFSINNYQDNNYWYQRTEADTMDMLDSDDMDKAFGLWAAFSYIIADLSVPLPRPTI